MKRTFVVIIAVALICNLGLTSLASNDVAAADASSVSQKNSSQYTIQVAGNQVQFLLDGKITKTIDTKNTKISLVASNSGGIALRLTIPLVKFGNFLLVIKNLWSLMVNSIL